MRPFLCVLILAAGCGPAEREPADSPGPAQARRPEQADDARPDRPSVTAADPPRTVLETAVKAHGGPEKLAASLTGRVRLKMTGSLPPAGHFAVTSEETFQLPRRYRRLITGEVGGMPFRMEYAVVGANGWTRRGTGPAESFRGREVPLEQRWNATLALLPSLLGDEYRLAAAGTGTVDGRDAVGVKVARGEGEWALYFDGASGLLVKSKRRMPHPLSGQEVDGEVVYSGYKDVSGVPYPMRMTTYTEGEKMFELEIAEIQFLDQIDDRLFDKP